MCCCSDLSPLSVAMGNLPSWIVTHGYPNSVPSCIAALICHHSVLPWEIYHLGLSPMAPNSVPWCIAVLTWYHSVLPREIHHLCVSPMKPKIVNHHVLLLWFVTTQCCQGKSTILDCHPWVPKLNSIPSFIAALTWYNTVLPWEIYHLDCHPWVPK